MVWFEIIGIIICWEALKLSYRVLRYLFRTEKDKTAINKQLMEFREKWGYGIKDKKR